jgi:hypothetical protein
MSIQKHLFVGSKVGKTFVSQIQWVGAIAVLGFLGKPATALCAVPLLTPSSALIVAQDAPRARSSAILAALTITRGRPSRLPFARAFRNPARTRS